MIEEAYVSFENAKLLKEKGFNEPCLWGYDPYCASFARVMSEPRNSELNEYEYSKPTHQVAMRWLREVHHIYLNINVRVILGQWSGYDISIHATDNDGFLNKKIPIVLKDNMSYEQACEAVIKYCLENLI